MEINQFENLKEHIKKINEIHLEETAWLVKELGEFGVGSGFELNGIPFPEGKIKTEQQWKELALAKSICQFWSDAGRAYITRNFRACAILLACLVEALICFELLRRKGSFPEGYSLGQLIGFCEKEGFLLEILNDAKEVNRLRKIAVHLMSEKTESKAIFLSNKFDEIVPLEKFKNPPAQIKNGWVVGNGVEVCIFPKPAIRYRYKKLAKVMYQHVQKILKTLYGSKFKFEFEEKIDI